MTSVFRASRKYLLSSEFYSQGVSNTRSLSTVAKRTTQNDPSHHNSEHIGLFHTVPSSIGDELFQFGGLPKSFKLNVNTFGETSLMIRSPAVEIINYLEKTDYNRPAVRYALYGKSGCGKSLTLAHLLHYAFTKKFIIVHVPWVWDWFRNVRHEVTYSTTHEGLVNLPLTSAQWLKHFQLQNNKLFKELDLPISKTYVWNQRESTAEGSQLLELVNHGINRVKYAADVVLAIISELKTFSTNKRCKTFVAIDGFNALFGNETNLKTEDRTKVTPSMVTLTKAFLEATQQDWSNAAITVTLDQMSAKHNSKHSHQPLYLLGRKGFEHLDPFIPICVEEYSDVELNSALDYYEDRKWLQKKGGRHELTFLSNRNPYQLMNLCAAY